MKRIYFPFYCLGICMLLLFSCSPQWHSETELEAINVREHGIKKMTQYQVFYHAGIPGNEFICRVVDYDSKGNKRQEKNFNEEGSLNCHIQYSYNANAQLVRTLCLNPQKNRIFQINRTYDAHHFRKELTYILPDGSFKYKNVAICDEEGKPIQITWYRPEGLKAINKLQYVGQQKVSDAEYDPSGFLNDKWEYTYHSNGNLTQAIQWYPGHLMNAKITYEYDSYSNLRKESHYAADMLDSFILYCYNRNQVLIEKDYFSGSGILSEKNRFEDVYQ